VEALRRWLLTLPAEAEEALCDELWDLGCLGLQLLADDDTPPDQLERAGRLRLEAYFPDPLPEAAVFDVERWWERGVEWVADEPFTPRDYLADYRASATPFSLGRRFRVDPGEPPEGLTHTAPEPDVESRWLLRLPARTAFGTGSHESTRLALRLLENLPLEGRRVLDVGTGSGILAFACRLLGAGLVAGYDIDLETCLIARQNMDLNGLPFPLFAGPRGALVAGAPFDVLLVNVLPERIAEDLPHLVRHLRPGGSLVSSGNLVTRRNELLARFGELGLALHSELEEGEWVAFHLVSGEG
jgi:ribosomal protein L11 methyltransferase